jgi:TetR/AcrR family transcriptional regulator, tetracycline repressor protein
VKGQRGRPRARFEGLDTNRILGAAMAIVDTEGIEALSMRKLGKSLGVDPMAIYYYVPSKQALIASLVQRVFGEVASELNKPHNSNWDDRVRFWASTYLRISRKHHQLVVHLINDSDAAGHEVMQVNEVLYAALVDSGMSPRNVLRSADMIVDYLHGLLLSKQPSNSPETGWRKTVLQEIQDADSHTYPAIRNVYTRLDGEDLALHPEFGIEIILAGVQHLEQDSE